MELSLILAERGLSHAEYAVLFHVRDTVVVSRAELADWVARTPPSFVDEGMSFDGYLAAIGALIGKGLLVELTKEDIEADVARWRSEKLPLPALARQWLQRRDPGYDSRLR